MHLCIGLDIDEVLYRTIAMETDYINRQIEEKGYHMWEFSNSPADIHLLKNLKRSCKQPSLEMYADIRWINQDLVKVVTKCLADHPDWEFVVITSRASSDETTYSECMSKTQRKRLMKIRTLTMEMVKSVLPITRFYFVYDKDVCMVNEEIDVLIDDCDSNVNAAALRQSKYGILLTSRDSSRFAPMKRRYVINSLSSLQEILEAIETNTITEG